MRSARNGRSSAARRCTRVPTVAASFNRTMMVSMRLHAAPAPMNPDQRPRVFERHPCYDSRNEDVRIRADDGVALGDGLQQRFQSEERLREAVGLQDIVQRIVLRQRQGERLCRVHQRRQLRRHPSGSLRAGLPRRDVQAEVISCSGASRSTRTALVNESTTVRQIARWPRESRRARARCRAGACRQCECCLAACRHRREP
jgi:hypothetical protein